MTKFRGLLENRNCTFQNWPRFYVIEVHCGSLVITMSSGEEDDTWELLKENKVVVPEGVRRIPNDLDFKWIRVLVNEPAADIEC